MELKLSNNGGIDAASEQIRAKQYAEPFKADKRKVIAFAIELDEKGKGLVDWKVNNKTNLEGNKQSLSK